MRRFFLFVFFLSLLACPFPTFGEPGTSFKEGLHLYHTGRYGDALKEFKSLHEHQPSGTGKFQYFMALSEDRLGLEHQAFMDLEGAIHTNPSLTFTNNPGHVRSMHKRLMHQVIEGQSPLPPPHQVTFSGNPEKAPSHAGWFLALLGVGAFLIFLALRKRTQSRIQSGINDKEELEGTAARLMKAVDKVSDDKNYYLLDHPDKKEALEAAFRALDPAYRNVLNILREPETPQTDWSERRTRFEAALAPIDSAILNIRGIMGEAPGVTNNPPLPGQGPSSEEMPPPGTSSPPIGGDRCVFCGRDAKDGRTVPLERQGKVAYARACPTCLAEMEQNYQRTGTYQPPSAFYTGGLPYMGGGLSFGDLMLLDWMSHEGGHDAPPVQMPDAHPQGDWGGGGMADREDRESGAYGQGDRS